MEVGSQGGMDGNQNQSPLAGLKRPKRQMKTPFQLEVLEETYTTEIYPSEATRAELSGKLNLTDRQLQMWFCHRRLKDKKEGVGIGGERPQSQGTVGGRDLNESMIPKSQGTVVAKPGTRHDSGSGTGSGSGSGSSKFDGRDDMVEPVSYYEVSRTNMEQRVIACVEEQLGEPLRDDCPILGIEFDELPPGAFGAPIVSTEQRDRYRHSHESKSYGQYDEKHIKAGTVLFISKEYGHRYS